MTVVTCKYHGTQAVTDNRLACGASGSIESGFSHGLIRIHHRHTEPTTESGYTAHQVWKLVTVYNETAFDAKIIDQWVEEIAPA